MKRLTLYSRAGCHLCEDFLETLLPLLRGRAEVTVVDIDVDTRCREAYNLRIPVLTESGRVVCEASVDPQAVQDCLSGVRE